jgi:Na+-transporting methylmalonyl-CoA/oxaloacetate decarboxylase gamma subunit
MSPLLAPILAIAARLLGLAEKRNEDKNAPDVKAAQKQQDQVDAEASEIKAVAARDAATVQKNLAE